MVEQDNARAAAVKRLKAKRDFKVHLATYLIINALLVGIWLLSGKGYFWPAWVMIGWGVGLAFNAWTAYFQRPISEADIRREMEKER